ncbi:MAG: hypothetical protein ACLQDI_02310 [Syntrophobacteraceae bacterium]
MALEIKNLGKNTLFILIGIAVIFLLPAIFFYGAAKFSSVALPWLHVASWALFVFSLLVLVPCSLFRRTRVFAAKGFFNISYLFGLTLWCMSLMVVLAIWGWIGVIIGICMAGIGIVPLAFLALILNAGWGVLAYQACLIVAVFGWRLIAVFLAEKIDESNKREQPEFITIES